MELFTNYLYPFEVAGTILLVAMVAAIGLAFRGTRQRHLQSPSEQVKVKKSDRLEIVKMPAEKGPRNA